nr:tetraspanin 37 [Misgurnus anguillicaudatus]
MALPRRIINICIKAVSLLLLLAGISLIIGGAFLLHKYRSHGLFFSNFYILLPALLAVISGLLILISGSLGCVLSSSDPSCCLQGLFVYILIVVFCAVSTTAALASVYTDKLDADLAPLKDVFQNYSGNNQDVNTRAVNALQSELQCCGVKYYTDWLDTPWFNHSGKYEVPVSCCNKTFDTCNGTLHIPAVLCNEGCQIKFEKQLSLMLRVIMIASLVVILVLVFSWMSVGYLMKHQPPLEYQILNQE